MRTDIVMTLCLCTFAGITKAQDGSGGELQLKTANGHLMQYYVSLPDGWNAEKKWPVVVIAEAAEKEYKINAERFIRARGTKPFILVAPITTTNGRQGYRSPEVYPYSNSTWDAIDQQGICYFDMSGIEQIVKDIQKNYNGSDKFFLTGFEAGAHIVWAFVFKHPEELYAACPVGGNYIGRCMEDKKYSEHPSRAQLPVKALHGALDTVWVPGGRLYYQFENAKKEAAEHGFKNITEQFVPNKAHEPLPEEILGFFMEVWLNKGGAK